MSSSQHLAIYLSAAEAQAALAIAEPALVKARQRLNDLITLGEIPGDLMDGAISAARRLKDEVAHLQGEVERLGDEEKESERVRVTTGSKGKEVKGKGKVVRDTPIAKPTRPIGATLAASGQESLRIPRCELCTQHGVECRLAPSTDSNRCAVCVKAKKKCVDAPISGAVASSGSPRKRKAPDTGDDGMVQLTTRLTRKRPSAAKMVEDSDSDGEFELAASAPAKRKVKGLPAPRATFKTPSFGPSDGGLGERSADFATAAAEATSRMWEQGRAQIANARNMTLLDPRIEGAIAWLRGEEKADDWMVSLIFYTAVVARAEALHRESEPPDWRRIF